MDITYNVRRCIHAERCVQQLKEVFDPQRRPWIQADNAAADEVARTVLLCPSGALHYQRKDGGAEETAPRENKIRLWQNGPLELHGDLSIVGAQIEVHGETRATLCRCGASRNKPFCDNSHRESGFEGAQQATTVSAEIVIEHGGTLTITPEKKGSLHLQGNVQIYNETGALIFAGNETWLCRCGGSANKPFCDMTHQRIGFEAE